MSLSVRFVHALRTCASSFDYEPNRIGGTAFISYIVELLPKIGREEILQNKKHNRNQPLQEGREGGEKHSGGDGDGNEVGDEENTKRARTARAGTNTRTRMTTRRTREGENRDLYDERRGRERRGNEMVVSY